MDGNYIKISRSILEWEWYGDINTCRLFIHMLLKANWTDGKFKGTTVPRGSFVSSIDKLAEGVNMTRDEVRTAISHLLSTGEITKQSTNKYTVFTLVNWDLYQVASQAEPNQGPSKAQPIPKLFPTIEEEKEIKKGRKEEEEKKRDTNVSPKKERARYFPEDEALDAAFADFVEMRKKIKKPMTDRAIELAMKKLQSLSVLPFGGCMDNDLAIKILEQSIMNNWQGLFPLKEEQKKGTSREEYIDRWRDV